jgi:glutathione synthase/RimK-type ligase-like ATP-grasp enzyme
MPRSCPDDAPLLAALAEAGIAAEPVPWDAPADWARFRGVLLRATWDYFTKYEAFLAWFDRLEALGLPVWNPLPVLRWNSDKRYLRDLAARGARVVPTRFAEPGKMERLARILDEEGWDDAVVKPLVSGGAHATFRTCRRDAPQHQKAFELLLERGGAMVQPFQRAVTEEGEWSLVFFDGVFDHAVLKKPDKADFRVQEKHGGTNAAATPPPGLVEDARRVLAAAPGAPLLYARVDGLRTPEGFLLMELEALEPELFFRTSPGSARRFAGCLGKRLENSRPTPS